MRYVIAIKREFRDEAPTDWVRQLRSVDGLVILGDAKFDRLMVEASEDTIERVRLLLGDIFHVEPVKRYRTSAN